jgi:hypothetical protein
MAVPRMGYLVTLAAGVEVFVLSERDAKTYPGRVGHRAIVAHKGDNGTTDLPQYYALDPLKHPFPEAAPLVFDKVAADARDALRTSAKQKPAAQWTDAERVAMGDP